MEEEIARLSYSTRQGIDVPSEYVIRNRGTGEFSSLTAVVADRSLNRLSLANQISTLFLEYTQRDVYDVVSLFPLFALWFRARAVTDREREEAFDAIRALGALASAGATEEMTWSHYAVITEQYTEVSSRQARVRRDRERLATLLAERELDRVRPSDYLLPLVHDLDVTKATSTFLAADRPTSKELFERVQLDYLMPFAAIFFPADDGSVDARYRFHAASAEEDMASWKDALTDKDRKGSRDPLGNKELGTVVFLVRYQKVLNAEQERQAIAEGGDETRGNGEEDDLEQKEVDEEREAEDDAEEEEATSVPTFSSRKKVVQQSQLYARLTYLPLESRYALEYPNEIREERSRRTLEQYCYAKLSLASNTTARLTAVKGVFSVFEVVIVPELLLHLINTDPRIYPLLYIIELQFSTAEKQRLSLHYLGSDGSEATITLTRPTAAKKTDLFRKGGRLVGYNGDWYFQVKISKATDRETTNKVKALLVKVFSVYLDAQASLIETYAAIFPDEPRLDPPKLVVRRETLKAFERSKMRDPMTFRGQGRSTQTTSQVDGFATWRELHPTAEDLVPARLEETMRVKAEAERRMAEALSSVDVHGAKREILLYRGIFYISQFAEKPYLGFKETASTKGTRVPSCYAKRQNGYVRRPVELYPGAFEITSTTKPRSKREQEGLNPATVKPITTLKILVPDSIGVLTSAIATLLSRYNARTESGVGHDKHYLRLGVPFSADALVHCACRALEIREYLMLDREQKARYARRVRTAELVRYVSCGRQELYDHSVEEILDELRGTAWLDPRRYYRLVEEWMRAKADELAMGGSGRAKRLYRIFMLERTEDHGLNVIVPRHQSMHIRDYAEQSVCVLLFLHRGQECNNASHDQVELIVSRTKQARAKEVAYTFDSPVLGRKLRSMMRENVLVRRLEMVEGVEGPSCSVVSYPHDVVAASALFSPLEVTGQQLDSYGKLRLLELVSREDGQTVVVSTGPLAPLCVPERSLLGVRNDYKRALAVLGRLRLLSRGRSPGGSGMYASVERGEVRALHLYVGALVDVVTCLVEPVAYGVPRGVEVVGEDVEVVRGIPYYDPRSASELGKLQRLKRALSRILEHVETTWVSSGTRPSGEEHVSRVCRVEEDAFTRDQQPVVRGVALLDSDRMRAWMVRYVDEFVSRGRRLPPSLNLPPPYEPVGRRVLQVPNSALLQELSEYISYTSNELQERFDLAVLTYSAQPYFFLHEGSIRCLQMVHSNQREVALACAYNWAVYKVNTGYRTMASAEVVESGTRPGTLTLGSTTLETVVSDVVNLGEPLTVVRFEEMPYGMTVEAGGQRTVLWGAVLGMGRA
jgi:hypothetical protein